MGLVVFHVTDRANRESIRAHGLDWRRMSVPGIAGSPVPESEGVFLAEDESVAKWFAQMGRHRGRAVDIWEVSLDLELDFDLCDDVSEKLPPDGPLVRHADGYLCYLQPIAPEFLKLIHPEALWDQ